MVLICLALNGDFIDRKSKFLFTQNITSPPKFMSTHGLDTYEGLLIISYWIISLLISVPIFLLIQDTGANFLANVPNFLKLVLKNWYIEFWILRKQKKIPKQFGTFGLINSCEEYLNRSQVLCMSSGSSILVYSGRQF